MTSYAQGNLFESGGGDDDAQRTSKTSSTTPSGEQAMSWVVVAKTMGLLQAQIMAERLQSDGIRAWAWQEGAGRALGLTVGLLGEGRVLVLEEDAMQARAILDEAEAQWLAEEEE
jgi:hypothetical protein